MRAALLLIASLASLGCDRDANTADDVDNRCGAEDDAAHAARTAGEAAKTGGKTAWEGLKTAGTAVGGLFEGGTEEAKARWEDGKSRTKETAEEGAADTNAVAADDPCP